MNKTTFCFCLLALHPLMAADFLPSPTEEHPLTLHIEKFKTSPETIEEKASVLASDFSDLLFERYRQNRREKQEPSLGQLIQEVEPMYNSFSKKGPERKPTNLSILKEERIQQFIHSFILKRVSAYKEIIKGCQETISEKWGHELKTLMMAIDISIVVEDKLYQKFLAHEKSKLQ